MEQIYDDFDVIGKKRKVCRYGYLMQILKGWILYALNVLYNEALFWIHFEPSNEVEFARLKSMNRVFPNPQNNIRMSMSCPTTMIEDQ